MCHRVTGHHIGHYVGRELDSGSGGAEATKGQQRVGPKGNVNKEMVGGLGDLNLVKKEVKPENN